MISPDIVQPHQQSNEMRISRTRIRESEKPALGRRKFVVDVFEKLTHLRLCPGHRFQA